MISYRLSIDMLLHIIVVQRRAAYRVQQLAKRWYLCLFYWMLDVAIINAFIVSRLYKDSRDLRNQLNFRLELIQELLSRGKAQTVAGGVARKKRNKSEIYKPAVGAAAGLGDDSRLLKHLPAVMKSSQRCAVCSIHKSKFMCLACKSAFCLKAERNCFLAYHSECVDAAAASAAAGLVVDLDE